MTLPIFEPWLHRCHNTQRNAGVLSDRDGPRSRWAQGYGWAEAVEVGGLRCGHHPDKRESRSELAVQVSELR